MRVRAGILVVVLAAALTACGGGGDKNDAGNTPSGNSTRLSTPTAKVTQVTLDCGKYSDTAQKIVAAQQKLYTGGDPEAALAALNAELDAVKDGAPADVKAAVDDLEEAFQKVEDLIKNPTSDEQTTLAAMGAKLSTDGQKIATYIVSQCNK